MMVNVLQMLGEALVALTFYVAVCLVLAALGAFGQD